MLGFVCRLEANFSSICPRPPASGANLWLTREASFLPSRSRKPGREIDGKIVPDIGLILDTEIFGPIRDAPISQASQSRKARNQFASERNELISERDQLMRKAFEGLFIQSGAPEQGIARAKRLGVAL